MDNHFAYDGLTGYSLDASDFADRADELGLAYQWWK